MVTETDDGGRRCTPLCTPFRTHRAVTGATARGFLYDHGMRGFVLSIALAGVGCTAPNPDFGDTSTSAATTGAETSLETGTTTTATTAMPETSVDPTTDPTSSGGVDPVTTGAPSVECCDNEDCSEDVLSCVCPLAEANCCSGTWASTCPNIAIACGGVCDGVVYPCCEPREPIDGMPQPACTGIQNLGGFCFANPECCLVEWTPTCVAAYDAATGECGLESCEVPHSSPGCGDPAIVECVCNEMNLPQCCTEMWHEQCVTAAMGCG